MIDLNISIFNKTYTVRRFGEPTIIDGYVTHEYTEFKASLNVHPSGQNQTGAPEGERKVKHLEGHGTDVLQTADQKNGTKGDLLLYHGDWYECISAEEWDHTLLNHYNYRFVLVAYDGSNLHDMAEPEENRW